MAEPVVVGPVSEVFGSPEWLRARVNIVGNMLASAERDCTVVAEHAPELRRYCEAEGITWADFVAERLEESVDFLDYVERGVTVLRAKGREGPITRDEAVEAGKAATIAKVAAEDAALARAGEVGRGRDRVDTVKANAGAGGNDLTYTLRRLKRDAPELFEAVASGELSANAAAQRAGFRRPVVQVTGTEPERTAERLIERFGRQWCADLVAALDMRVQRGEGPE